MVRLKVRLIIEDRGMILMLKQTSRNGGKYTLVGGTVEDREFAMKALKRESKEEAGIILDEEDLKLVYTLHKKKGEQHRIVMYFKASKWKGEPESREPKKFKKVSWFPLEHLPQNLSPTVKHVLKNYRKGGTFSEFTP